MAGLPCSLFVLFFVFGVSSLAPQFAIAQLVSPFGKAIGWVPLSLKDRELLKKAIWDALEKGEIGVIVTWDARTSGQGRRAVVTETFEIEDRKMRAYHAPVHEGAGQDLQIPALQG